MLIGRLAELTGDTASMARLCDLAVQAVPGRREARRDVPLGHDTGASLGDPARRPDDRAPMYTRATMPELLGSIIDLVNLSTIIDIGITALLIYWLFSLIRGTRAVRLVIGVSVLFVVYALAVAFRMLLLTQILQAGAVVGLFALVVVFQPELRRALERIGRVGSFGWLFSPAETRARRAWSRRRSPGPPPSCPPRVTARSSSSSGRPGLEEVAETGVMIHGDVSADLLQTIFTPRSALHDGAVIIREDKIVAAGALLPLAETSIHSERFGTRHRAALGITEQTDAVVIVVSEENGQISLVERARIVRNLTEAGLARAIQGFLDPAGGRAGRSAGARRPAAGRPASGLAGCNRCAASWDDRNPFGARRREPPAPDRRRSRQQPELDLAASAGVAAGPSSAVPPETRTMSRALAGRPDPAVRRILLRLVHNWPLKLAAVGLATLLYGGLVASQSTRTLPDVVPIEIQQVGQPADSFLLTSIDPVTRDPLLRAVGSEPLSSDFQASIDLSGVQPGSGPQRVPVRVVVDRRLGSRSSGSSRRRSRSTSIGSATKTVDVVVDHEQAPDGPRARATSPSTRPASRSLARRRSSIGSTAARASVIIQPSGIDVDQDIKLVADRRARRSGRPGRRRATRGPRHDPGLLRSRDADAAGQPGRHRRPGGRLRDRQRHRRPTDRRSSRATPISWPSWSASTPR